jgi:hypothetical protein
LLRATPGASAAAPSFQELTSDKLTFFLQAAGLVTELLLLLRWIEDSITGELGELSNPAGAGGSAAFAFEAELATDEVLFVFPTSGCPFGVELFLASGVLGLLASGVLGLSLSF